MKRVVIALQGGIGNQLFQLAFGERFAHISGASLMIDISRYKTDTYSRSPALNSLFLKADVIDWRSLDLEKTRMLSESSITLLESGKFPAKFDWPENIENIIVDGYWQDYRYVTEEFKNKIKTKLNAVFGQFSASTDITREGGATLSVHVRRADYKHHGLCDESYYIESINFFQERYKNIKIFVFTDEPNYTQYFLNKIGIQFQLINTGDDVGDLYIMSVCRNHVISNSTFSWWGAFISSPEQVIYPDPWSLIHRPSEHLCPPLWKKFPEALEMAKVRPVGVLRNLLEDNGIKRF